MSDYSEHLISMAGGDGEPDLLGEIEARLAADRDDFADGYSDQSIRDRAALVAMAREAGAKALEDAAASAEGMHDPVAPDCQEWADWLTVRAATLRGGS